MSTAVKTLLTFATLGTSSAFAPTTNTVRGASTTLAMAGSVKVALRCSDSNKYLGHCNGCVPGGAFNDNAFVHVDESEINGASWAHWTLENLGDQKYILQADSSNCLSRCNGCIPDAAYPDNASVHVSLAEAKEAGYAQWIIEQMEPGKYALKCSDSGNYLGRCNGCVPGGAYADSAFVHVEPSDIQGASWAHWNIFLVPSFSSWIATTD